MERDLKTETAKEQKREIIRQTWVRVRGDVATKAEVRERKERGTQPAVANSEDGGRNPCRRLEFTPVKPILEF